MCSKPEKSVQKLARNPRTKIYAADLGELASILASRFQGSPDEFKEVAAGALRRGDLVRSSDRRGVFFESKAVVESRRSSERSSSLAGATR